MDFWNCIRFEIGLEKHGDLHLDFNFLRLLWLRVRKGEREIEEERVSRDSKNIDRVRVETKTKEDEVDFGVDRFGSRLVSTDDLECTFYHSKSSSHHSHITHTHTQHSHTHSNNTLTLLNLQHTLKHTHTHT